MAGERRVKNEDGGEREERCEFTRQVRGWFHALLSSGATTIPGIRYAGPLVTSRQTVSVVSQLVHAVCVLASVLAHWNAPDNADLKNYVARHRSSLSRGTAGQRDQGEQDAFVPFFPEDARTVYLFRWKSVARVCGMNLYICTRVPNMWEGSASRVHRRRIRSIYLRYSAFGLSSRRVLWQRRERTISSSMGSK